MRYIYTITLTLLVSFYLSCSGSSGTSSSGSDSSEYTSLSERSIEFKMATLNAGGLVADNDPTIAQFTEILDRLDNICKESRSQIADMIVFAHKDHQKDTGRKVSLLWIAQQLNASLPEGSESLGLQFAEVSAMWLTLAAQ